MLREMPLAATWYLVLPSRYGNNIGAPQPSRQLPAPSWKPRNGFKHALDTRHGTCCGSEISANVQLYGAASMAYDMSGSRRFLEDGSRSIERRTFGQLSVEHVYRGVVRGCNCADAKHIACNLRGHPNRAFCRRKRQHACKIVQTADIHARDRTAAPTSMRLHTGHPFSSSRQAAMLWHVTLGHHALQAFHGSY